MAAIIVVPLFCAIKYNNDVDASKSTQTNIENSQAIASWRQNRKDAYDTWIKGVKKLYGEIELAIPIVSSDPQKTLLLFKEKQILYFSSAWVKFGDIIDCQIIDNPKIVSGQVVAISKGDLWNEIKRSSMQRTFGKTTGTWLAGPEKYITEYQKEPDKVYHNYSIIIGTSDIHNSMVEIKVGEDAQIAHRIHATINAIIATQHNS